MARKKGLLKRGCSTDRKLLRSTVLFEQLRRKSRRIVVAGDGSDPKKTPMKVDIVIVR